VTLVNPSAERAGQGNLTGNARDLWMAGIRDIRRQSDDLKTILEQEGVADDQELVAAIEEAIQSTDEFADWLEAREPKKDGPSGIGKDNYTWYLQNVHLVPLTWEDEVMILKRELARAWSSLKLEEHRNRYLPQLIVAASSGSLRSTGGALGQSLMNFLEQGYIDRKGVLRPGPPRAPGRYMYRKKPATFFWITAHYDPRPLILSFLPLV
jgi:hypothetical protein